ncbi:hypothetical protein [Flavobacterium polysaccharolyticum]|uniref:Uncharacterized protein n=1 Tax=Flavobacterium polysaccharolyticum TaxID=3133148 RepID=A0ABU9NPG3_9FLAO
MSKIIFDDYKRTIRTQYEKKKMEDITGILMNPSPAQLRNLCLILFDQSLSNNDEITMKNFFSVKEKEGLRKAIEKCEISRFRPIRSFLLGEKNSDDIGRIDMGAILVDFNPRPFSNFLANKKKEIKIKEDSLQDIKCKKEDPVLSLVSEVGNEIKGLPEKSILNRYKKALTKVALLCSVGIGVVTLLPKKECMQWNTNHYEVVDCSTESSSFLDPRIPINKDRLDLKKLDPQTIKTYFENGNPIIWYAKNGDEIELFNQPGLHPTTDKTLKPITPYIINKYLRE